MYVLFNLHLVYRCNVNQNHLSLVFLTAANISFLFITHYFLAESLLNLGFEADFLADFFADAFLADL